MTFGKIKLSNQILAATKTMTKKRAKLVNV